jgi:hypothetical protein
LFDNVTEEGSTCFRSGKPSKNVDETNPGQPLHAFFTTEREDLTADDLVDSFGEPASPNREDLVFMSRIVDGQLAQWPPCYFGNACPCSTHIPVSKEVSAATQEVARTRALLEAHLRYGHRNFRSLAKALNLQMPAKLPFCKAC